MRVLHTADVHLGLGRGGHPTALGNSRVEDFLGTLQRFVEVAQDREVDLAILAGDTFDTRSPGLQAVNGFAEAIGILTRFGTPTVMTAGNHDGMATVGNPETHALAWLESLAIPNLHVLLRPGTWRIKTKSGPVDVSALPFPHRRAMQLQMPNATSLNLTEMASRAVEGIIEGELATAGEDEVPHIFVGHLTVVGGRTGSERAMRFGWDVSVRAELLDDFDYAALGHLHPQQAISERAWYAGSPEYIDYSEQRQLKGFLLVEVAPKAKPVVEVIPSNPRPLGELVLEQQPDGSFGTTGDASWYERGPIIRVRLVCNYSRPGASEWNRVRSEIIDKGASFVDIQVELGEALTHRVRLAAMLEGPSIDDLHPVTALRHYLTLTGKPLEPALSVGTALIAEVTGQDAPPVGGTA